MRSPRCGCSTTRIAPSTASRAARSCRSSPAAARRSIAAALYYYGRHERFNSTEFFRARSQRLQGIDPFPPKYRFNTYGANLGGPVLKEQRKLFFFYSMEAPQVQRPQSVQTWRMPSALERQGDFSQTFDAQGRLINIRDPRKVGLACNAVTGGPGCFDGNIIPASMINPNHMQAMLKLMPLPEYDPRTTQGNYNYDTEEVIDIPKLNNVARIDWRPTSSDSFSFTFKDWWQDQRGARITAGPSNWQWFFAHYKNTDRGFSGNYTKVLRSNLVWDTDFGSRRQTEVFYPLNDDGVDQGEPHGGRLHGAAVPSRAEPARRAAEGHLRRRRWVAELQLRQPPVRQGRGLAVVGPVERDLPARQSFVQDRRLLRDSRQLGRQGRRRRRRLGR